MIKIVNKQISEDGTVKFLFRLANACLVETVLMSTDYGNSVCVSSQAGCNMGCRFCASGLLKKEYDLKAEEMLEQVKEAKKELEERLVEIAPAAGKSEARNEITHIVVMGCGEPFDNFDEVIKFCEAISDERKFKPAVAPRHITVSTCGLVPKIYDFAKTEKRYQLAISLHAPNNKIRDELMPVNRKYPLVKDKEDGEPSLIRAVKDYTELTKKRVTAEYILLEGINDSDECAEELSELLKGLDVYVNLIPFNGVNEFDYKGASKERALRFYDILMKNQIKATLRKERGSDIDAACGQLRSRRLAEK